MKKCRRTKLLKFRLGAENFDLVPKILSTEKFCPPKILSDEVYSKRKSLIALKLQKILIESATCYNSFQS